MARGGSRKFLAAGLPLIGICVAGLYGITELVQGRMDYRDLRAGKVDERAPADKQYFQKNAKHQSDDDLLAWLKKQTLDAAAVEAKPIARPDYNNPEGIH